MLDKIKLIFKNASILKYNLFSRSMNEQIIYNNKHFDSNFEKSAYKAIGIIEPIHNINYSTYEKIEYAFRGLNYSLIYSFLPSSEKFLYNLQLIFGYDTNSRYNKNSILNEDDSFFHSREFKTSDYLLATFFWPLIGLPFYLFISLPFRLVLAAANVAISIPVSMVNFIAESSAILKLAKELYKNKELSAKESANIEEELCNKIYNTLIFPIVTIVNSLLSAIYAITDAVAAIGFTILTPLTCILHIALFGIYSDNNTTKAIDPYTTNNNYGLNESDKNIKESNNNQAKSACYRYEFDEDVEESNTNNYIYKLPTPKVYEIYRKRNGDIKNDFMTICSNIDTAIREIKKNPKLYI